MWPRVVFPYMHTVYTIKSNRLSLPLSSVITKFSGQQRWLAHVTEPCFSVSALFYLKLSSHSPHCAANGRIVLFSMAE